MSRKIKEYNSVNIANISSASIWDCMKGNRDKLDTQDAVLTDSLFSRFLQKSGLKIDKNFTRDIICVTFSYASADEKEFTKSYDEICNILERNNSNLDFDILDEMDDSEAYYLMLNASLFIKDQNDKVRLTELFKKYKKFAFNDLDKFDFKSKDDLLKEFYKNGCEITYEDKIKDKNKVVGTEETTIEYKMLCRSTSKAKKMEIMFINKDLYDVAIDYLTIGLQGKMPAQNAKIVELSAYSTLICSSLINNKTNTLHLEPNEILILKDVTVDQVGKAMNVYSVDTGEVDENGEKIYQCDCSIEESAKISNTLFDGQGLLEDDELFSNLKCSFVLTRNHMWKSALFNTKIQLFFKDYCKKNGINYDTFYVSDMFGHELLAKNIKCIVSEESIKWKKFADLMGDVPYEYWIDWLRKDDFTFGIVKTDHPSKYDDVQRMSYQMINTLPTFEYAKKNNIDETDVIRNICKYSIDKTMNMKNDDENYIKYLSETNNKANYHQMIIELYHHNEDILKTKEFVDVKKKKISKYKINELMCSGKIQNAGDNLTIIMQPLAMLYHAVNDDINNDKTLANDTKDYLTVSTKQFKDSEMIACFRNPHNSPSGIIYAKNVHNEELDRYFNFNSNIIVVAGGVNNFSDWQDRLNSADQDSDFVLATNQKEIVECAKIAYQNYCSIVNNIALKGNSNYGNTLEDYARMDLLFGKARLDIGTSSNVAQLAMSQYWNALHNDELQEVKDDILKTVAILATLAQVGIDQCKRLYVVNVSDEINRLRKKAFMNNKQKFEVLDKDGNLKKKTINVNLPKFYAYNKISGLNETKDKKTIERLKLRINDDIKCPMNFAFDILNSDIKKANDTDYVYIESILCDMNKEYSRRKINTFIETFTKYNNRFIKLEAYCNLHDSDTYLERREVLEKKQFDSLTKVKLDQDDYLFLVRYALNLTTKNTYDKNNKVNFRLLYELYKHNEKLFMNCFIKNVQY